MCSMTVLIAFLSTLAPILLSGASLVDVARDRPALMWSVGASNEISHMIYLRKSNNNNNNRQWGECYLTTDYQSNTIDTKYGYTSDLQGVYQLQEVIVFLSATVATFNISNFEIFIDQTKCDDIDIQTRSHLLISVALKCKRKHGRTVTIVSRDRHICNLQVMVCETGLMGDKCKKPCSHSYGIACALPCQCEGGDTCDRYDGFCPQGCLHSDENRYFDCYFKSVESSTKSFYADFSDERKEVITSVPYGKTYTTCFNVKLSKSSHGWLFVIEWKFSSQQSLKAIDFNFINFLDSELAMMSVTIDGSLCWVDTIQNATMSKFHQCYNGYRTGKTVRLEVTAKDQIFPETLSDPLRICDVKLLRCHPGYFGPGCRLQCNCLLLPCHPEAGLCTSGKCMPGYKGPNCAQVDLVTTQEVYQTDDIGTLESLPPIYTLGPVPYLFDQLDVDTAKTIIKTYHLFGAFKINHVTIDISPSDEHLVSTISVYLGTELKNDVTDPSMDGLPCFWSPQSSQPPRRQKQDMTRVLDCSGTGVMVTVVIIGKPMLELEHIKDVRIWSCMDGTFGQRCEKMCHCADPNDVCDQVTGKCHSKCDDNHWGSNCQDQICAPSRCNLTCSAQQGGCFKSCKPGWMGANCESPCPDGFYGAGCVKACPLCVDVGDKKTCDARTGVCTHGCQKGAAMGPDRRCDIRFQRSAVDATDIDRVPEDRLNGVTFVMSMSAMCVLCVVVVLCVGKYNKEVDDNADGGDVVIGKVFKSIHDGWQWVESANRFRGYDITCDACASGDLTHMQKVAIWILCQDFDEFITRRQQRLEAAAGRSISDTTASKYSTLENQDVHALYDMV